MMKKYIFLKIAIIIIIFVTLSCQIDVIGFDKEIDDNLDLNKRVYSKSYAAYHISGSWYNSSPTGMIKKIKIINNPPCRSLSSTIKKEYLKPTPTPAHCGESIMIWGKLQNKDYYFGEVQLKNNDNMKSAVLKLGSGYTLYLDLTEYIQDRNELFVNSLLAKVGLVSNSKLAKFVRKAPPKLNQNQLDNKSGSWFNSYSKGFIKKIKIIDNMPCRSSNSNKEYVNPTLTTVPCRETIKVWGKFQNKNFYFGEAQLSKYRNLKRAVLKIASGYTLNVNITEYISKGNALLINYQLFKVGVVSKTEQTKFIRKSR